MDENCSEKLITNKTARVFISGNNDNPDYVYIICHGYGQLANFLFGNFHHLLVLTHYLFVQKH